MSAAAAAAALEVAGVAVGYGKKEIVRGVDLAVEAGKILLVLGHNGAGKTTLMRAIFGLLRRARGALPSRGARSPAAARRRTSPTASPSSRRGAASSARSRCATISISARSG